MAEVEAPDFKPGDVVRLKSGGPLMTVSEPRAKGLAGIAGVYCAWFDGASLCLQQFTNASLMAASVNDASELAELRGLALTIVGGRSYSDDLQATAADIINRYRNT